MDISQVSLALKLSLSNSEEDRKKALQYINDVRVLPLYGPTLLKISSDENTTMDIRQNSAIQLKNFVHNFWKFGENPEINRQLRFDDEEPLIVISKEDKELIKTNIVNILTNCQSKPLMKLYNQVIKKITKYEFPQRWPELVPIINEMMKSNEEKKVFSGVNCLLQIAKNNEFEIDNPRNAYQTVLESMKENLENLMEALLTNYKIEFAAQIVKKILKIYSCSIQITMPKFLMDLTSLSKWFSYFKLIITSPLDSSLETKTEDPIEIEKLTKNVYWKIKYQSFNIAYRIYQKYGIENKNDKVQAQFSKIINEKFAPLLLEVALETLFKSSTQFIAHNVTAIIFKFLNMLPQRKQLMDILEKNLEAILKNHIIQETLITKKDIELWDSNPKNYVYKKFDISENFFIKRYNATQFVKSICSFKRKNEDGKRFPAFFHVFYKYFIDILKIYDEQKAKGQVPDLRIKEAVFEILHTISEQIENYSPETIEELLSSFVVKELDSEVGMLRERACELCQSFSIKFIKNNELFKYIVEKMCKGLQDKDLPVRIVSAIGIPYLLKREDGRVLLKPFIKDILTVYLKLMDDIDLDELLNGLSEIVSDFKEDISEFSVSLVLQLVTAFHRLIKVDLEDDDGEAQMAASGCIKTILKIMDVNCNNSEIYVKIEQNLDSILQYGITPEGFDNLEDVVMILNNMTSKSKTISPYCWNYLSPLVDIVVGIEEDLNAFVANNNSDADFQGLGYEMFDRISIIFMNFIIREPEIFLTGSDNKGRSFLMRVMYMIERVVKIGTKKKDELDTCHAIKILIALFESCKGKVDNLLQNLIKFILDNLKKAKTVYYKIILVQAICSIFIYDPVMSMTVLESLDLTQHLFELWISLIPKMTFDIELKRSLMGLGSVLLIPPEKLNQKIKANIGILMKQIVALCDQLTNMKEKVKLNEVNDDDSDEDDEEKLEKIKEALETAQKKADEFESENILDDDDDEDLDDSDYHEESKGLWKTNVENKCEFVFVKDLLNYLYSSNVNWHNEIIGSLTEEERNKLKASIEKSEKRNGGGI